MFAEWLAYWQLEPFGEWRADLRSAHEIASNANLWRKKGSAPIDPMRLILFPLGPRPYTQQSPQEIERRLRAFGEHMNALNAEKRRRLEKARALEAKKGQTGG